MGFTCLNDLFDDVRIYLPKYLSEEEQQKLFFELSQFPENLDKRFYTFCLNNKGNLFQGDIISEILIPDYEQKDFHSAKGFLISNSCDMDLNNPRLYSPFLVFCPIFSLRKYEEVLLKKHPFKKVQVVEHIEKIRAAKITTFFYLPSNGEHLEECYVRLDNIFSIPVDENIIASLLQKRLFSLSQYGFYALLIKLSIHFTRIREAIPRDLK